MSYTIGLISRWDTTALTAAGDAIATRRATAEGLRTSLADGRDTLSEGWSGVAADAVLDAAETEKSDEPSASVSRPSAKDVRNPSAVARRAAMASPAAVSAVVSQRLICPIV